jgi:hypothetical protein
VRGKQGRIPPFYSPERSRGRGVEAVGGEVGGRPPLMAMSSVGGGYGEGKEVRRWGSACPVGRWSGAGEERREGGTAAREAGGRAVWPAMEAARGWGRPRQVGPTCRRL